jgi:hypothetical protein
MVRIIAGNRGAGKTKQLIAMVVEAVKNSNGDVVCIERGDALKFDLSHKVRLIDIQEYGVAGAEAYCGFIAGLMAGNYDITSIFGDATFKILSGKDSDEKDAAVLAEFLGRLEKLTSDNGVELTMTVSFPKEDLPESIKHMVIQ